MTVGVTPAWNEGTVKVGGSNGGATLNYIMWSDDPTDTMADLLVAIYTAAPPSYLGLTRETVSVPKRLSDPLPEDPAGVVVKSWWQGAATYSEPDQKKEEPLEPPESGNQPFRWRIRSGPGPSRTRTESIELYQDVGDPAARWSWKPGLVVPSTRDPRVIRLLGLQSNDGKEALSMYSVEGAEVSVGSIEVIISTVRQHSDAVGNGFLVDYAELVANQCTNATAWEGFPAGSLKIVTMDADQRASPNATDWDDNVEPWDVTFTMQYAPPTTIDTGELPAFSRDKLGHEYLDVQYDATNVQVNPADPDPTVIIPVPVRMSLHKIYPECSFQDDLHLKRDP